MEEDICGSIGVYNIRSYISLDDVCLSFYYWDYLQVGLCDLENYFYAGMDWYLNQIENL